jgi:hypothetical protein
MECAEVRERIPELLTGTRDQGVEEHLVRCEPCRREVESVRRVLDLVQRATLVPGDATPPPFEQVLARVRSRRRALPRLLARAAALLLASLVGAGADRALLRSDRGTPPEDPRRALEARADARRAIAERPGGLGASLAVLNALAVDRPRR